MVLFRDVRIKDKREVMKNTRSQIVKKLENRFFNWHEISILILMNYIEDVLLDTDFDKTRMCFTYPLGKEMTVDQLTEFIYLYISENMGEFLFTQKIRK